MYIPKRYGESMVEKCPFCGRQAITRNKQKIPVCKDHKDSILDDLKCACGNYLETKVGKFGLYFSCPKCGNMNPKRVLEMNQPKPAAKSPMSGRSAQPETSQSSNRAAQQRQPREILINPDDPDYFG